MPFQSGTGRRKKKRREKVNELGNKKPARVKIGSDYGDKEGLIGKPTQWQKLYLNQQEEQQ